MAALGDAIVQNPVNRKACCVLGCTKHTGNATLRDVACEMLLQTRYFPHKVCGTHRLANDAAHEVRTIMPASIGLHL